MKRRKAAVSKELLLFFVLAVANRIVASLIYKQYRNVEIRRTKNEKTYSRAGFGSDAADHKSVTDGCCGGISGP